MSSGPSNESQNSRKKCNKIGKNTRDVHTQRGQWLRLKQAIEKDDALRAAVLNHFEDVLDSVGMKKTPLTPEVPDISVLLQAPSSRGGLSVIMINSEHDERELKECREALSSHHVADLAWFAHFSGKSSTKQ